VTKFFLLYGSVTQRHTPSPPKNWTSFINNPLFHFTFLCMWHNNFSEYITWGVTKKIVMMLEINCFQRWWNIFIKFIKVIFHVRPLIQKKNFLSFYSNLLLTLHLIYCCIWFFCLCFFCFVLLLHIQFLC